MKILILSFYYAPDLCPGSFRASAMVEGLLALAPDARIDVLTTMPNRYSSFVQPAPAHEQHGNVSIRRMTLPPHQSGMADQSRAFLAYARGVAQATRGGDYDLVVATSSRLMTAVLGAWVAGRLPRARLYLDIRDIFADTIKDILPRALAGAARIGFGLMEGWAVRRAHKVNLISPGFGPYFLQRYPRQQYAYFSNGIDREFLLPAPPQAAPVEGRPLTVMYAGNIGEGQGLHLIVPELAARLRGRVQFTVVGDGGMIGPLRAEIGARGLDNVTLVPPMKRSELISAYQAADILFVHLNDYEAFKKVLPSKLFEYAAMGKPIWAGVAGYAAQFAASEIDNAGVFAPCDADGAVAALARLHMGWRARTGFIAKFQREAIARDMAADMLALAHAPRPHCP